MLVSATRTRTAPILAALAALAALASFTLATGRAEAKPFTPPAGKIFAGVSDMGNKNDYFAFTDAVDRHVAVMQAFEVWGGNLQEAKQRWKRTQTRGILSISTSPCYECDGVITPRAIASGKGDAYLLRLHDFLDEWDRPTYIRLMPEMNGHWNAYAAFDADGSSRGAAYKTKHFRKAWRRVVLITRGGPRGRINNTLLREGMPKIQGDAPKRVARTPVSFIWCPQTHGSPRIHKNRPAAYWPGERYVDWVGADIYGKYPNFDGLERFYDKRKGFPFMIGEWSPWDYDNPGFVNSLYEWAESHRRVRMLVYYQGFGDGNPYLIQHYPASERALRKQLDNKRYLRFAPDSERPSGGKGGKGGKGGGKGGGGTGGGVGVGG